MISIQMKKGVLELCVVSLLAQRAHYGYELAEKISESIEISEGTIYPLLKRLRDDSLVSTYLEESTSGAPRKYYQLTEAGKEMKEQMVNDWNAFILKINLFLKKNNNDKK